MNHLVKDTSYDIIDSHSIHSKEFEDSLSRDLKFSKTRQTQAVPAVKSYLSQTEGYTNQKSSSQPKQAIQGEPIAYDVFKNNDIKSMSYSERIKAFFSNATYNMKTFSKGSWRNVKINKETEFISARLFDEDFHFDEKNPQLSENLFNEAHKRIIWFSYRKNFPMIRSQDNNESQSASSDFGWGCMIRCSQMLLAETLKRHYAAELEFNFLESQSNHNQKLLKSIIKLFLDSPSNTSLHNQLKKKREFSLFGIQHICQQALLKQYQNTVKTWYTSIQASVVLQEILEENQEELDSKVGLSIVNFSDQIIFLKELQQATQGEKQSKSPRSLLLLIHMKFGVSKFHTDHIPYFVELMRIPNFIGALTGTDTKGMYIVGYQDSYAIVLDPHYVQESTEGEENLEKDFSTYFNENPRSLHFESLSSDISLGFYIDILQLNSIDIFVNKIYEINEKFSDPLISVLIDRVEVTEDQGDEFPLPYQSDVQSQQQDSEHEEINDTTQIFAEKQEQRMEEFSESTRSRQTSFIFKELFASQELIKHRSNPQPSLNQEVQPEQKPTITKKYISPWGGPELDSLSASEGSGSFQRKNRANSDFEVLF